MSADTNKQAADTTDVPHPLGPVGHGGDGHLKAGLKNRHLSMIAIGGVIGAGLFVGSGAGIASTGPGSCSPTPWPACWWCW